MALLWAHIMMLQCILMLLGPSFIMCYFAQLWYFCFLSKIFRIVHWTLLSSKQKYPVVQHKNKNQFMMYPCLEIRFIVFVQRYFICPSDSRNIPREKQFSWICKQGYTTHWFLVYYPVTFLKYSLGVPTRIVHYFIFIPQVKVN